ncbi:MAG: hypothetical protein KIH67_002360 [Candidatus Moranbacteria bacterium]|nr:hypothetical protein [Candidatus Moranbacteria bacterium]
MPQSEYPNRKEILLWMIVLIYAFIFDALLGFFERAPETHS